jgi:hypothetical protein
MRRGRRAERITQGYEQQKEGAVSGVAHTPKSEVRANSYVKPYRAVILLVSKLVAGVFTKRAVLTLLNRLVCTSSIIRIVTPGKCLYV